MSNSVIDGLFSRMARRGDSEAREAHPDLWARSFYATATPGLLAPVVTEALRRRGWIDDFHLLDLVYRVARRLNTERLPWADFLPAADLDTFADLLATRNVATFVPERYRALALFTGRLTRFPRRPLRVADWGCGVNAGLAYAQAPRVLSAGRDDWVSRELDREPRRYADATGFDVLDLDQDEWTAWTDACAYAVSPAPGVPAGFAARRVVLDVCAPFGAEETGLPRFDVIYCSMMIHQLASAQRNVVLANAARSLAPGGFLVESTFVRNHVLGQEWNTATTVRALTGSGALGPPLTWLLWESSRCSVARPGPDHGLIDQTLRRSEAA